jgi:carboxypeptidase Q
MTRFLFSLLLLAVASSAGAAPVAVPDQAIAEAQSIQQRQLQGSGAYDIVKSLTTEIGPRIAGSPADLAAVAWGERTMKAIGFDRVWTEPVTVHYWRRIVEKAAILTPTPQPLLITALGGSGSTPQNGIDADIALFPTLEAFREAPGSAIEGRIVVITSRMERHNNGQGYGKAVAARLRGPAEAAKRGAVALLIRSVGTDSHRLPHTGAADWRAGGERIPAAALSNPDADQLERVAALNPKIRLHLDIKTVDDGPVTTANVVGEIAGGGAKDEIVLLGAHLDSWDLGTGALDDGAGVGMVLAAAKAVKEQAKRPSRTLRVVLFASEEPGLDGARAYAAAHKGELSRIALAHEVDLGQGPVYQAVLPPGADNEPLLAALGKALLPLGVPVVSGHPEGSDVSQLAEQGVPLGELKLDASTYFDFHHTSDDTLDKLDPAVLDRSTACVTTLAWLALQTKGTLTGFKE